MSKKRSKSRSLATQAIYQWQVTGASTEKVIEDFLIEQQNSSFQIDYFRDLVNGVPDQLEVLDKDLQPLLDRPVEEVDLVERAILRLGAYELLKHPEVPYRVVINEWVELAKIFGADQGHRYINGVLDKLAHELRAVEIAARKRG